METANSPDVDWSQLSVSFSRWPSTSPVRTWFRLSFTLSFPFWPFTALYWQYIRVATVNHSVIIVFINWWLNHWYFPGPNNNEHLKVFFPLKKLCAKLWQWNSYFQLSGKHNERRLSSTTVTLILTRSSSVALMKFQAKLWSAFCTEHCTWSRGHPFLQHNTKKVIATKNYYHIHISNSI